MIGSDNPEFFSGDTDLRGVFVAEGVQGQVTAVARKETDRICLLPRDRLCGSAAGTAASSNAQAPAKQGQQVNGPG